MNYHMRSCNASLNDALSNVTCSTRPDLSSLGRYKSAIEARLRMNAPYVSRGRWHEAMAIGALPHNAAETASHLNAMLEIVCAAGSDKAANNAMVTYGERAAVGGVYLATELFMLTDESEDSKETWEFLGERLSDIQTVGSSPLGAARGISDTIVAAGAGASAVGSALIGLTGPEVSKAAGDLRGALPGLLEGLIGGVQEQKPHTTPPPKGGEYNTWMEEKVYEKASKVDHSKVFP